MKDLEKLSKEDEMELSEILEKFRSLNEKQKEKENNMKKQKQCNSILRKKKKKYRR